MYQPLPKQNQHFVPESFLRLFAREDGFFDELDIENRRIQKRHVGSVCCYTNYFDIPYEEVVKKYELANLRYLEYSFNYERVLPKTLNRFKQYPYFLHRDDFRIIVEAYISFKHRNPYYRKLIGDNKIFEPVLEGSMKKVKSELFEGIDKTNPNYDLLTYKYEQTELSVKQQILSDPERPKRMHLEGLVETAKGTNRPMNDAVQKLMGMNIIVHQITNKDDYFFVSDNPGFTLNELTAYNTRLGNFETVHFPINSKQMLLLRGFNSNNYFNPLINLIYLSTPSHLVNQINRITTTFSNKKVYCENRQYLENFKNNNP